MIGLLSIIAVGFFLGMRHATDPDHVIAVATIVTRQRNLARAALIGAFWGLGHTLTIFAVGACIILFNLVIPARIGLSMELSVGVMLIILGVINVSSFFRSIPESTQASNSSSQGNNATSTHNHAHSHGDFIHSHRHSHDPEIHSHNPEQTPLASLDGALYRFRGYQHLRPLLVGIVHGLAGSAAVALLVLTTIRDPHWAIAYLLIFGIGTIAGMMVITMSLATTLKVAASKRSVARRLSMASGVLSLAFGVFVVYQMGIVNGLFTSHPMWVPK